MLCSLFPLRPLHPPNTHTPKQTASRRPQNLTAQQKPTVFPADKRHRSEEILAAKGDPWQINLYSHVEHGFAVRGAVDDKRQRFAKEQAFLQAVAWFDAWLL